MSELAGSGSAPKQQHAKRRRAQATFGLLLGLAFSCSSDAVGVDGCRQIERARCRAAAACGEIPDAESCERFYRDQCLHGFSVPEPSDQQVDRCADALDAVAECAREGDDSGTCRNACNAVSAPESLRACAFLSGEEGEDAGGGEGGVPADSDDATGMGGASGGQGGAPESNGGAPPADEETAPQGGNPSEGGSGGADQSAGTGGDDASGGEAS